jgi:endoplasmic reticulum junction formation protein lunapark
LLTVERKDQKTLEKLRAERKAKIDELKERTNYYLTQQLIQVRGQVDFSSCKSSRVPGIKLDHASFLTNTNSDEMHPYMQKYDLDPAAKAAAASVLASKLGEETGLKVHVGEEQKVDAAVVRSNDVEISSSDGLRNRKQPNARRTAGTVAAHSLAQGTESSPSAGQETAPPPIVVEHHQGSGAGDGGWIAKVAALLVGEDPSQSYALICGDCHMHNGMYGKLSYVLFSHTVCTQKTDALSNTVLCRLGPEGRLPTYYILLPPLPCIEHIKAIHGPILRLHLRPLNPSCSC